MPFLVQRACQTWESGSGICKSLRLKGSPGGRWDWQELFKPVCRGASCVNFAWRGSFYPSGKRRNVIQAQRFGFFEARRALWGVGVSSSTGGRDRPIQPNWAWFPEVLQAAEKRHTKGGCTRGRVAGAEARLLLRRLWPGSSYPEKPCPCYKTLFG
jgi:hypothetical protein